MILRHGNARPSIHASAWVAADATVCGDVAIGAHSRVMFGARVIASGGRIEIGEHCIVMENAVIRSTPRHSTRLGSHCLVGPHAHLVGCTLEERVFIATGAAVFHGATLEAGSEVRVRATVHLMSRLPAGATVPIGWIAVGDPVHLEPPERHDAIWKIQEPLNFPLEAYGLERDEADMVAITRRLSRALAGHADDETL